MIPRHRAIGEVAFTFIRPPSRRVWLRALVLDASADRLVLAQQLSPSKDLAFDGEIVLGADYWSVWFLFNGEPFDIARIYRPDGTWTGYYVDVLEPVRWRGGDPATLEPMTDLFLDVWIAPDGRHIVLDEDEFEEAVRAGHLTSAQIDHARRVLREIVAAVDRGAFLPAEVTGFRL